MLKKMLSAAVVASVLLAATPSVSHAQQGTVSHDVMFTVDYIRSNCKKGKTTKADLLAAFGQPTQSRLNASDSGSVEVLQYQRGAAPQAKQRGGVGRGLRGLANLAAGVAEASGYSGTGQQAARFANTANRMANGADTIEGAGGAAQPAQASGPSTLVIELTNDVVSSWTLN